MSTQCGSCLHWIQDDIMDNGVFAYRCNTCKWEAPLEFVHEELTAYPKKGYLDWAKKQYQLSKLYSEHLIPTLSLDEGYFMVSECKILDYERGTEEVKGE